jgi:hypothetical protein
MMNTSREMENIPKLYRQYHLARKDKRAELFEIIRTELLRKNPPVSSDRFEVFAHPRRIVVVLQQSIEWQLSPTHDRVDLS